MRSLGVLFAAAAVTLSGCAARGGPTASAGLSTTAAADAPVRPGDQVVLEIWNEPEMSDTFAVAERGELILPKLGVISVAGQTVQQVQDSVRSAYSRYLRNPSVRTAVLRRIGVSGAVREPGIFLVDLTNTLPDVLTRAGGLVESANPNNIIVQRGTERLRFRADDRHVFVGAELRSGDQVFVEQKNFIQRNPLAVITTAVPLIGYLVTVLVPVFRD